MGDEKILRYDSARDVMHYHSDSIKGTLCLDTSGRSPKGESFATTHIEEVTCLECLIAWDRAWSMSDDDDDGSMVWLTDAHKLYIPMVHGFHHYPSGVDASAGRCGEFGARGSEDLVTCIECHRAPDYGDAVFGTTYPDRDTTMGVVDGVTVDDAGVRRYVVSVPEPTVYGDVTRTPQFASISIIARNGNSVTCPECDSVYESAREWLSCVTSHERQRVEGVA